MIDKVKAYLKLYDDNRFSIKMAQALIAVDEAVEPLKGALQLKHPDNFKSGWNEAMEYVRKTIESTEDTK